MYLRVHKSTEYDMIITKNLTRYIIDIFLKNLIVDTVNVASNLWKIKAMCVSGTLFMSTLIS